MNTSKQNIEKQLIQLIKGRKSFAVYHLPLSDEIKLVIQLNDNPTQLYNLSELNGKKGFVISPFNVTKEYPIVLINPDIEVAGLENIELFLSKLPYSNANFEEGISNVNREDNNIDEKLHYRESFNRFIEPLKRKEFRKLVLSRSHSIAKPINYSFFESFLKGMQLYSQMMSYICYTPSTGLWVGNTPEIMLTGENEQWNTVSLAGTQSLISSKGLDEWDQKNIEEQNVVSEYIHDIIVSHASNVKENGPYTALAGTVAHLKTDFTFYLNNNKIGDLLNELYPTPAICGFPKKEAFQFIIQNEFYNRKYYSGIIGMLNPEGKTDLYVNLRCAEINDSYITLYAGGGIMPTSSIESEWEETGVKMQTLLNVL